MLLTVPAGGEREVEAGEGKVTQTFQNSKKFQVLSRITSSFLISAHTIESQVCTAM